MSYDLSVYATDRVGSESMLELIHSGGLGVDGDTSGTTLSVVRGARRAYTFTLEMAQAIEAEDVPEEVTAVLLAPRYVYELLVEGSSASSVPHAVRFARKLARAANGVVIDEQEGTLWSRGSTRTPPKVERGEVDIVQVRWWVSDTTPPEQAATKWLELARRHLPDALPRQWGTYEPLSHKASTDRPNAFFDFLTDAGGAVYFKASAPVIEGRLGTFFDNCSIESHSVTVHRSALHDERWRAPLKSLFIEFAEASRAILATAEVIRNVEWSGRGLGFTASTERAPHLAAQLGWIGLPPYPTWWTWFGSDYVELVRDHLPAEQVAASGRGLFHWRADVPADRDELSVPLTERRPVGVFRKREDYPAVAPS